MTTTRTVDFSNVRMYEIESRDTVRMCSVQVKVDGHNKVVGLRVNGNAEGYTQMGDYHTRLDAFSGIAVGTIDIQRKLERIYKPRRTRHRYRGIIG